MSFTWGTKGLRGVTVTKILLKSDLSFFFQTAVFAFCGPPLRASSRGHDGVAGALCLIRALTSDPFSQPFVYWWVWKSLKWDEPTLEPQKLLGGHLVRVLPLWTSLSQQSPQLFGKRTLSLDYGGLGGSGAAYFETGDSFSRTHVSVCVVGGWRMENWITVRKSSQLNL